MTMRLQEADAALDDAHAALKVEVLASLSIEPYYAERVDESAEFARRAIEIARRLGDPPRK